MTIDEGHADAVISLVREAVALNEASKRVQESWAMTCSPKAAIVSGAEKSVSHT